MTRRMPLVVGNWKMNTTVAEGIALAESVRDLTRAAVDVEIAVLPPFTHLWPVAERLRDSAVGTGAQDVFWAEAGAYTGSVSAAMVSGWCRFVLVGHSERRHTFGDSDDDVARKVAAVLSHDLRLIVAVGETESQRDADETAAVVTRQVDAAFAVIGGDDVARVDVAYEPVWAIGTGRTATPAQAQEVCALIRERLHRHVGDAADAIRILYGGSVTPTSAAEIFAQSDIDGGLIGGASLKPADFAAIVEAARVTASHPG